MASMDISALLLALIHIAEVLETANIIAMASYPDVSTSSQPPSSPVPIVHQENGLWPQDNLGTPKATQVALGNQSHKARQVSLQRHFPLDMSFWMALEVTWVALVGITMGY